MRRFPLVLFLLLTAVAANAAKKIVVSDGPDEWVRAHNSGQPLVGSWVVETNGPGTGHLVGPTPKRAMVSVSSSPVVAAAPVRTHFKHVVTHVAAKKKVVMIDPPVPIQMESVKPPEPETAALAPVIQSQPQSPWQSLVLVLALFATLFASVVFFARRNRSF